MRHENEVTGRDVKVPPDTILRARAALRRLDRATRETLGILRELERPVSMEHYALYEIGSGEAISDEIEDDVVELLHRARADHPDQEIRIIFGAQIAQGGGHNGNHEGEVRYS